MKGGEQEGTEEWSKKIKVKGKEKVIKKWYEILYQRSNFLLVVVVILLLGYQVEGEVVGESEDEHR